jgi:predicted amidohydrolase
MIGVYQGQPKPLDKEANLSTIERTARSAAEAGAKLVIFPELFLTGYNQPKKDLHALAEPRNGPTISKACGIAKETGVGLLFGFPERGEKSTFNSAALIDGTGNIVTVYRKIQLFGDVEPTIFERGSKFEVVDFPPFRIGIVICYDIEFPEISRKLTKAGANLIAVPTANMAPYYDVPTTLVRARALENGVAVAYSNLIGTEGGLTYTGLSCIVGSDGMDVARAGRNTEALLLADVSYALANPQIDTSTQLADLQPQSTEK